MVLSSGERLGPYELLSPLGEGGMGEVWKARDTRLDRAVAIKVAKHGFDERFHREARAIASMNHPHICTLFDVGENYLVMEYVEGSPIRGPLPVSTALQYGAQIARALAAAHHIGIVHRDLKPGNILVTKGGVKLLDFGLAKMSPFSAGPEAETVTRALTEEGAIAGTVPYMAPEQLEGKEADERSDIFALGCVVYEAITGARAFEGASRAAVIAAILEREAKPLTGVPAAAASAVNRCLAKDPEERWQSARDVALVFEAAAQQLGAPEVSVIAPVRKRWFMAALLGAAAALVLAAAGAFVLLRRQPAPEAFWDGQALGGPAMALGPRTSPDGQTVAFQAIVDGQAQVAIMKPQTGNWTVLTHQKDAGRIADIEWARDGSKIYFDRDTDFPRGIFSIEALGGEARLVLEDACVPVVLADGSLIVHRINAARETQLYRYWPDTGKITALPALAEDSFNVTARATHDGRQAVFYGYPLSAAGAHGALGIYRLDPETGAAASLTSRQIFGRGNRGASLAVTPDGKSVVYCVFGAGLNSVVSVPLDGSGAMRQLFTLTNDPWYLDVAPDGAIYADEISQTNTVLRFHASGGAPDVLAGDQDRRAALALALPDGRPLLYTVAGFRRRFQIVQPDGRLTPLIENGEQFGMPAALAGDDKVAVMSDRSPAEAVVVGVADGRVQRRVTLGAGRIGSLAASPDGETFYYTAEGYVWSVAAAGGAPRKLTPGDAVSADANGGDLIVSLQDKNAIRLFRVAPGGDPQPIALPQGLRRPGTGLSASMAGPGGRIVLNLATPSEWFLRTGVLEPGGAFHPVVLNFDGETLSPSWTRDGQIIALGTSRGFSLWRFHQQ